MLNFYDLAKYHFFFWGGENVLRKTFSNFNFKSYFYLFAKLADGIGGVQKTLPLMQQIRDAAVFFGRRNRKMGRYDHRNSISSKK